MIIGSRSPFDTSFVTLRACFSLINSVIIASIVTTNLFAFIMVMSSCSFGLAQEAVRRADDASRFKEVAERIKSALNADDQDFLQSLLEPGLRTPDSRSTMAELTQRFRRAYGRFNDLGDPAIIGPRASFRVKTEEGQIVEIKFALDGKGAITSLSLLDLGPAIPTPERNSVPMRLPFDGDWAVMSGGLTDKQNHHLRGLRSGRFAVDFNAVDKSGRSHRSKGQSNDDYFAYGREVVASASGTVITVVDGIPDNRPGLPDGSQSGNCVIIRHADYEYSQYLHLKPYSMTVRPGDKVEVGQKIGLCGNSGNSWEPHLHFQLMNAPIVTNSNGIQAHFCVVEVISDGKEIKSDDYLPIKNDRVKNIINKNEPKKASEVRDSK